MKAEKFADRDSKRQEKEDVEAHDDLLSRLRRQTQSKIIRRGGR
jgi:hypothetical protein